MQIQNGLNVVEQFARAHRVSWKNALGSVFGAARRLHHYRDVHTRMVRDALCEIECAEESRRCNDE